MEHVILTIVGAHAGEGIEQIFSRKQKEIETAGRSFWLIQSHKARVKDVQALGEATVFFISSGSKNGAKPTSHENTAKEYSADGVTWQPIPEGIRVTGKLSSLCTALVLKEIRLADETIDLWEYADVNGGPVKMMLGASSVCCTNDYCEGMKSRYRNVVAVGKLCAPNGVWVR